MCLLFASPDSGVQSFSLTCFPKRGTFICLILRVKTRPEYTEDAGILQEARVHLKSCCLRGIVWSAHGITNKSCLFLLMGSESLTNARHPNDCRAASVLECGFRRERAPTHGKHFRQPVAFKSQLVMKGILHLQGAHAE